jgi:mRNA interferase YafQ
LKKCDKRGVIDRQHLEDVIDILQNQGELPMTYKPHILSGNYAGIWECHVQSDLLCFGYKTPKKIQ